MKTLTTTLATIGLLFGASAFAGETHNAETVAAELIKQQNAQVSEMVAEQVNQDIQFTLRAMQLPVVELNETMIAKAEQVNAKDDQASVAKFAE
ncbi:hypothetical protein DXX93_02325 [Thalassotalea euphylliae]|uniref:DUF4168 domain-containing protein n=1 Tax=Thalassotalea euphylliae TaxID=1655234 RepID=A0A3E0TLV0_9GAMM|nr:hypothetical protein [Thalassotalea euphylliae]REL25496.1 hypothetical protein DXX93_02325 [Thalassotalea euphylliae]